MAGSKGVVGGILLIIAGSFLVLVGLVPGIPAYDILGYKSFLYEKWLIYFFQFRWINIIDYSIRNFTMNFLQGMIGILALAGIMCLFMAMIFFIMGGILAFGTYDNKADMGITAVILFIISVATNICQIIIGTSIFTGIFDFLRPSAGSVILVFIDTTAIIVLILGIIGAAQTKADT
ncbi:MAG: hypothetical protein ACFFCM_10860 [Promethearchaeota archaeon]